MHVYIYIHTYIYICIYIYTYVYIYTSPWGGTGWLAGLRASVPSCVLKGYVGPYGALSPSTISCQLVWGVSAALRGRLAGLG